MRIVVTGALAYDYIMNFPGRFQDHILPEKAHIISVSFLVDSLQRMRGGVAGNIAYNLALLGERPLLVGAVGNDFGEYRATLDACGVDTHHLRVVPNEFTSSCFINTDEANNQIVAFYSGAMTHTRAIRMHDLTLTPDDLVIISASDPQSMDQIAADCQELGIPYVLDTGKQTPRMTAESIQLGLRGAQLVLGNDYEFGMMAQKLGISEADLIRSAPLTVITKGADGAYVYMHNHDYQPVHVPAVPVSTVVDPTGAGDAFVAGLVFGFSRQLAPPICARLGALASAYVIEQRGCQEHHFTPADFAARYAALFGTDDPTTADLLSSANATPVVTSTNQ